MRKIHIQYLTILARQRRLPFVHQTMGRWWKSNPKTRKEDVIDILALDKDGRSAIFCACKYRNKLYKDFFNATAIFTRPVNRFYYLFSKSGFTKEVTHLAQQDGVMLVGLDDLFLVDLPYAKFSYTTVGCMGNSIISLLIGNGKDFPIFPRITLGETDQCFSRMNRSLLSYGFSLYRTGGGVVCLFACLSDQLLPAVIPMHSSIPSHCEFPA